MAQLPVKPGEVATIVTHFEMTERPKPRPIQTCPLRLMRWQTPGTDKYRILFKRVGEHWLWFSRLAMADQELSVILHNPLVEVYAVVDPKGIEIGILELDFRMTGRCVISFLGLVPQLIRQGLGQWLMAQAIALGWRKSVSGLFVETSCIDDPRAMSLYLKTGFVAVNRSIDVFPDPRISGLLPVHVAPHVPLLK